MKTHTYLTLNRLPMALMRNPYFTLNSDFKDELERLSDLIKGSSSSLYHAIQETDKEDIPGWSKIRFSAWKYFNRSKYRCIPFNKLATVSFLSAPVNPSDDLIKIHQSPVQHQFTDWEQVMATYRDRPYTDIPTVMIRNSTIYQTYNEIRYIRWNGDVFELCSISTNTELSLVLEFLTNKRSDHDVLSYLKKMFKYGRNAATSLIARLIHIQLIWPHKMPSIIVSADTEVEEREEPEKVPYIIAERTVVSSSLRDLFSDDAINEAIDFLAKYTVSHTNTDLDIFVKNFAKRFDQQIVPLAIALDPQLGIGYGGLGSMADQRKADIMEKLNNLKAETPNKTVTINEVTSYLIGRFAVENVIDLALLQPKSQVRYSRDSIPNTIPVLFRRYQNKTVIDSVGGATANSILGRFSLCGNRFYQLCQEIADIETSANPEVDFFDIGYFAEGHTDNVNRRRAIYSHELSINSWPASQAVLSLDDLLVTVRNNQVILISKQSGRRVVPRIASAYNHSRADLALFRFLGDLQHQGVKIIQNIDPTLLFPDQHHYSRLVYNNIILFPETWLVPYDLAAANNVERLQSWLKEKNIDFLFKAGINDQSLVFDPNAIDDMYMFALYCARNQRTATYIQEALIDNQTKVTDEDNNPYAAQFVGVCYHRDEIYQASRDLKQFLLPSISRQNQSRNIFPGGEWLYYEIYCHASRIDYLLTGVISSFIKQFKTYIRKWFFVRYQENGTHLRLRILLKDTANIGELIRSLHSSLEIAICEGFITDVQIKTYKREFERYSVQNMPLIEELFFQDSVYVLKLLRKRSNINTLYRETLEFTKHLIFAVLINKEEALSFVKKMADLFSAEHSFSTVHFKTINKLSLPVNAVSIDYKRPIKIFDQLRAVSLSFTSYEQKTNLLSDFIHMHINRLFDNEQRTHEAVIYQLQFINMKRSMHFPGNQTELIR